jgi:hypothetical protein
MSKFYSSIVAITTLDHAQGPDFDAPIDGGLSLLLAAGVGYGVKKIRDSRKKKEAENFLIWFVIADYKNIFVPVLT